jgi:hypothetical protein
MLLVFVPIYVYSKSSIILGLAINVLMIMASLLIAFFIWVWNGYRFYIPFAWEHSRMVLVKHKQCVVNLKRCVTDSRKGFGGIICGIMTSLICPHAFCLHAKNSVPT